MKMSTQEQQVLFPGGDAAMVRTINPEPDSLPVLSRNAA
jgi:hypothetical protein